MSIKCHKAVNGWMGGEERGHDMWGAGFVNVEVSIHMGEDHMCTCRSACVKEYA
jgi:hypothetical protein